MGVFKLNFEQFIILNDRINSLEGKTNQAIFPLFYFKGEYVYVYKLFNGYTFCAIVNPGDFLAFKRRYLEYAYELTENYIPTGSKPKATPIPSDIPRENPNLQ